ncbi:MAG: tripartite tricarboxylate transporter substrate binding protein [Proteobacteria bacterium]|nr:tripartite tricarboxylate transporter substrate binding protein [Burkholderiales bacterium]
MALLFPAQCALAQGFPVKPVQLIAPFSAGGDADLAARALANVLPRYLNNQQVVVINRTGASGAIGSESVAKAPPDGYNLLLARVGSQAVLPALAPKLGYRWNEFTFLGLLELNPYVCMVRADSPHKTFSDLVAAIRKNPNKLTYSTAGFGTIHEMGPQMMFDVYKLGKDAAVQVPFKGGGDAVIAILSGQVDFGCGNLGPANPQIQAGKLRALVVTLPERFKDLPDVPTAREIGAESMERIVGWSALFGPPGMTKEQIAFWGNVLAQVSKDADWVRATEKIGSVPRILSPAETANFVRVQFETYERIGKTFGIVLNP